MFKIVRFPSKLERFFSSLETRFLYEHFEYFRVMVLLVAFAWGKRNITALYRHLDGKRFHHRSRFNNFANVCRFDAEKVLAEAAYNLLARLKPRKGETIDIILDDSQKEKRGKKMDAVGWIFNHITRRTMLGHQYVTAVILFRGFVIPFGIRLYVKEKHSRKLRLKFRKLTELARELIRAFEPPKGVKVRVLFDSFYLCPVVVKACREKGFYFVSTLKSNRNLFRGARKLKAGKYGKNLFRRRRKKRHMAIEKRRGAARYTYIDAGWLDVKKIGRLRVVYSRKNGGRKILALCSDDPDLAAKEIITAYDGRWSIEVFFKDAKQLLGLGQYQNRSYGAAVIHLHLVCFAYALLTHLAIERSGEKGKTRGKSAARLSIGDLQNELRRIVWEDLADYLKEMPDGTEVVKELTRLLAA